MKKKLIALVILIILLTSGIYFIENKVLVVAELVSGQVIYQQQIKDDLEFVIKYTHSVEKTPVWDYFAVKDGDIYLTSTKYMSYGAGLPFLKQNKYLVQDDKFIIKNIDTKLEQIPLRVSDYAKHKLLINDQQYKLYKLTVPQNLIEIRVENQNLYQLLAWEVSQWKNKRN